MARLAFGGLDFADDSMDGLSRTVSTWATPTFDATVTRSGRGRSGKVVTTTSGGQVYWEVGTPGAVNGDGIEYLFRAWIRFPAWPSTGFRVLQPMDTSVSPLGVGVALNTDGTVSFGVNGAVKSAALATDTWHCIEHRAVVYAGNGNLAGQGQWEELRVNGTVVHAFHNASGTGGGFRVTSWRFGVGTTGNVAFASAFTCYFDDWALNSNTGASDNSYPGTDEQIALLLPVADNAIGANWKLGNNTAPSGNAFDSVNNVPPTGKELNVAGAGDELRDAVAPTGVAADEFAVNLQSYEEAGASAGATIKSIFARARVASSNNTQTLGLQLTANPVIAEATFGVSSGFGLDWKTFATAIGASPGGVATATRPTAKMRLVSRTGSGEALVCALGAYVAFVPVPPTPPSVALTSPADGVVVAGTVTLTASTSGGSGGITQVEFLVDGGVVNTDTGSPYTYALDTTTLTDGAHTLTARVTDGAAQTATSTAVTITVDNTGPTVAITSPASGTPVTGTFTVTATASDPHTVDHVELRIDGVTVATDSGSPYTFTVDAATLAPGSRSLVARAFDSLGNHVDSAVVTVTVAEVTRAILVRERPPLRVSLDVETPSGRFYRWAPDDPRPENIPSGLRWSSTMPGGYESLDTTLPRRPGVDYRDLDRLSTIRVRDAGGGSVGEYRLERAPRVSGDRMAVSPSAVGWQAHLEDDKSAREIYVDRDLGAWGPPRVQRRLGFVGSYAPADSSVFADSSAPALETAFDENGGWSATTKPMSEGWYDAQGIQLGSLYYAWKRNSEVDAANANFIWGALLASDDIAASVDTTNSLRAAGPGAGTLAATVAGRLFAVVQLYYGDAGGTPDSQRHFAIYWTCLAVYGDHGLTKRGTEDATNAMGFYASDVVAHAVGRWAPLLVVTAESITPSGFVIPHLAFKDATTAAEIVRGATRYGLQDWAVWDDKTFWWHPRGEHARNWRARVGPAGLEETGPQADRLWESVIVAYQDVDGSTRTVGPPGSGASTESADLKDSDPDNPANQLGIIRRDLLQMGVATAASATEVGRRFLEESRQLDTSGRARIVGHVEDDHGVLFPYHAIRAGDTITFTDASDPSPRRIIRAGHSADERACDVDLDAPPEGLAALLERLQVVLVPLGL